jgi:hypothetical protein
LVNRFGPLEGKLTTYTSVKLVFGNAVWCSLYFVCRIAIDFSRLVELNRDRENLFSLLNANFSLSLYLS